MMRVVLDTNVLVSAAIKKRGKPERILQAGGEHFVLLCSAYILAEVDRVMARQHIRKWLPNANYREGFVSALQDSAEFVSTVSAVQAVSDAKDNPILACAVDGSADVVVTGDRHLLRLGTYGHIQIVTPAVFWEMLNIQ